MKTRFCVLRGLNAAWAFTVTRRVVRVRLHRAHVRFKIQKLMQHDTPHSAISVVAAPRHNSCNETAVYLCVRAAKE